VLRLISFEGGDGAGKTTQLKYLERYLTSIGHSYVSTCEPGGTALGKIMRRALLEATEEGITRTAEIFLYLADRAQHVKKVIRPALEIRQLVLCDRFADSTLAYQGHGRGFDLGLLRSLNHIASDGIKPDLTLLLDLPPAMGLTRTKERRSLSGKKVESSERRDRLEEEDLQFHERVRKGFLELARAEPERVIVFDASLSPLVVHEQIRRVIDERLTGS
jgi:dTMP kinase